MVEEPTHVKQLSLNHVCKKGLKTIWTSLFLIGQQALLPVQALLGWHVDGLLVAVRHRKLSAHACDFYIYLILISNQSKVKF